MKLICDKSELTRALNIVSKAIPVKTTMSILQCVMINAETNDIHLIANDMELGIDTAVSGRIEERGFVAVESRLFYDIIRKLPDGDVHITTEGENVTITSDKIKFKVVGRGSEEFTYLPDVPTNEGFSISQFTLKSILLQTLFSTVESDTNRMMSGELFELADDMLSVVSLDGHRISVRRVLLADNFGNKKVVVPGKALTEISRILSDSTEDMADVYYTDKHIMFSFDRTIIVSRLLEGEFYKIDQMFSEEYETSMSVNRRDLLECLDRTTLFVRENEKKPVILNISDDGVDIRIQSPLGSMDETVSINKSGKDLVIGFNPKFLMDALKAIDDETVDFYFVNSKAPCYIRDNDRSYSYLILPVNIKVVD